MSSWKDTFLGSGMRKQATITKRHQHKENLLIPKFHASLPDLLAIGAYAMPGCKYWQQKKGPRLYCKVLKIVPRKGLAFSNYNLWDPNLMPN